MADRRVKTTNPQGQVPIPTQTQTLNVAKGQETAKTAKPPSGEIPYNAALAGESVPSEIGLQEEAEIRSAKPQKSIATEIGEALDSEIPADQWIFWSAVP